MCGVNPSLARGLHCGQLLAHSQVSHGHAAVGLQQRPDHVVDEDGVFLWGMDLPV